MCTYKNQIHSFTWPKQYSKYSPPIPNNRRPSSEFVCISQKITYAWLSSAIAFATFNFHISTYTKENHGWNKGQTRSYLASFSLNRDISERLFEYSNIHKEQDPHQQFWSNIKNL
mmetsp:Transcript_16707/g.21949  ORF Transcript_16707/g.21949 Transcript_16707/m.21949 type:complete len:115 (+) Transcript_16707:362-706(+)